jgi:hypothetical protein
MPLSSRRGPWVLTLAGRARAACPVPSVHDLTRRVVDRPFSSQGRFDGHALQLRGRRNGGGPVDTIVAPSGRHAAWLFADVPGIS